MPATSSSWQGDPAWEARLSDLQRPARHRARKRADPLAVRPGGRDRRPPPRRRRHRRLLPHRQAQIVKGKDLSAVRWVIGTGGALTRIAGGEAILQEHLHRTGQIPAADPRSAHPDRPGLPLLRPRHPGPGLPRRGQAHLSALGQFET